MITLEQIKSKILEWSDNHITAEKLQQWGEEQYMSEELRSSNLQESDHFIMIEVLQYLEFININLTTKDDIPFILKFIDSGKLYKKAYTQWIHYTDNIDYTERANQLKNDPFYVIYSIKPYQPILFYRYRYFDLMQNLFRSQIYFLLKFLTI